MTNNSKKSWAMPHITWVSIKIFFQVLLVCWILYQILNLTQKNLFLKTSVNTIEESNSNQHPEYELIISLQTAFVKNAKKFKPSVVNVSKVYETTVFNNLEQGSSHRVLLWFLNLKYWLNKILSERKYISETIGSGVIISESGYILTNYHVIEGQDKILVRLSDKRNYFAKIIGTDSLTNLAVLKINSFSNLPHSNIEATGDVKVGQWVMAIGNPYGLQGSVTVGIVSGIGRSNLGISKYENFIQTDASINPGNSGGPLIDLDGKIIGINANSMADGSGIGFAIPIKLAKNIVEDLITNGYVERGWLGVQTQRMTPELGALFNIPVNLNGIIINAVQDGTPAQNAGIKQGDVVIEYDGKKINNHSDFKYMVADTLVGKKIPIKIIRDGQEKLLLAVIGQLKSFH